MSFHWGLHEGNKAIEMVCDCTRLQCDCMRFLTFHLISKLIYNVKIYLNITLGYFTLYTGFNTSFQYEMRCNEIACACIAIA